MIKDQIGIGVFDESTRKPLLANPKLILQKAIDVLYIEEQIERDAKCLHTKVPIVNVFLVTFQQQSTFQSNLSISINFLIVIRKPVSDVVCCMWITINKIISLQSVRPYWPLDKNV